MSTKFVCFINAHTRKPILVNPDHVRTATEAESQNGQAGHLGAVAAGGGGEP